MDLMDIGIVIIAWLSIAGLVVACAVIAGRTDRAPRRAGSAEPQLTPVPASDRPRTFERRSGTDRRVPAGMRTAIH